MKCPQCNTTLREGLKFCTKCGNNLAVNPPVSSGTPGRGPFPPELTASVDIHEKRISQDPLNPDLYIAFGGLYRDYKYYEEALVQYQKAVNLDPSRSDAHRLSGQAYLALGNYERAKVSFEKALSSTPDPEAQTGLFLALKGMDKTEDAIAMGSGLLAGDGRHPELYRAMADLYLSRGMEDDAISMLTSLAALSPDREVHREISRLYRKRSMPDEALLHAQKVLSLDPKDSDALLEAGAISREKGDLDAAGHYLEALLGDEPGHTSARAWLALVHADKGDLARAAKTLDALPPDAPLSAEPEDRELVARAYGQMGEKALASGDTIKAKEHLKASLKYAKDPEVSSVLASIIGKEADNAFARQDYQGASLLYERAADLDGTYRQKLSSTRRIIAGRIRKKAVMIGAPVLCVLLAVCAFFIWRHYTTGEVILSFFNADTEVERFEIDGTAYKPEPQTIRLPRGEHKVFAKAKQGYKDDTSTYTLKGGEKKELYISLDKLPEVRQETGGEATGQAQGDGEDVDLKAYVESITASSSTRDAANNVNYLSENLWDNEETTAWAVDLRKDPKPYVVMKFRQPVVITGFKLLPGYKKYAAVDRYLQNHKLKRIRITYEDTSVGDEISFDKASSYETLAWQYRPAQGQIVTRSITIKVLETYPGMSQGNRSASNDLCVSEFHVLGHAAKENK